LRSKVKRRKIHDMVQSEKLDFLAIQETNMEAIPDGLIYSFLGNNDCGWAYLPTVGNSGRLRLSLCLLS
jgi:hypothetical protein